MAQAVSRRSPTSEAQVWSQPIPVAVRSKAWVCGRSLTGIVGLNPTGGMDVCVLLVVRTVAWNVKWHEGRKELNSTKMDQRGKTPDKQKKKNPRSVHVEFVLDRVALGQVLPRVLRFFPVNFTPPVIHYLEKWKKLIFFLFIFITGLHNKP